MAIGLANVNNRKAKSSTSNPAKSPPADAAGAAAPLKDAWSSRGLAREGRSANRERKISSGDLNTLWLDWTTCVTGSETPNRVLRTVRRILDLETFVFEFLVYELQIQERAKKMRIFGIRKLLAGN